jgi:hypothetical protein
LTRLGKKELYEGVDFCQVSSSINITLIKQDSSSPFKSFNLSHLRPLPSTHDDHSDVTSPSRTSFLFYLIAFLQSVLAISKNPFYFWYLILFIFLNEHITWCTFLFHFCRPVFSDSVIHFEWLDLRRVSLDKHLYCFLIEKANHHHGLSSHVKCVYSVWLARRPSSWVCWSRGKVWCNSKESFRGSLDEVFHWFTSYCSNNLLDMFSFQSSVGVKNFVDQISKAWTFPWNCWHSMILYF